jgi:putative copper resistance protein D
MTALVICRFAHFMAAMLTVGASAYLWLYTPEKLRRGLSPALWRLSLLASVIIFATAIIWLALESASMADDWSSATDPGAISDVLTDTAFGRAWALHLVLAAALIAVIGFGARGRWATVTIVSAALLASLGLVGHAAMQTGAEGVAHRANHAVHLLTTAMWIGGLVPFVMCLDAYRDDDLRLDAVSAMSSFSFWGQFVVAAIILTGGANIALTSGRPPIPPTTPYRVMLVAKIGLVAIMISLAVFNRYVLVPRLKLGGRAFAVLRATSAAEVLLGSVVVALVSAFALLDPA